MSTDRTKSTVRDLIRQEFTQVWTEFYEWEQDFICDKLRKLSRSKHHADARDRSTRTPASIPASMPPVIRRESLNTGAYDDIEIQSYTESPAATRQYETIRFERYSKGSSTELAPSTSSLTLSSRVICASQMKPSSAYESCPLTTRSIFTGDDKDEMEFIPFADEREFDAHDHCGFFGSFSWDKEHDPDLEIIVLETAQRLRTLRNIMFSEIDEADILPFLLLSSKEKTGCLESAQYRDLLGWPGATATYHSLRVATEPAADDVRARLKSVVSILCPSISCIQPWCSVHVVSYPMPPSQNPDPKLTVKEMIKLTKQPCGIDCFVYNQTPPENFAWTEKELDTFKVIFEVTPDTLPCYLAVLCQKPCREVFHQRNVMLQGQSEGPPDPPKRKQRTRVLAYKDVDPDNFTPDKPCRHGGPCDSQSQCSCFFNKAHCQRNCHCPMKCDRRWRGCNCSKTSGTCSSDRCPCFNAHRECDPELCVKCKCKDHTSDVCQNSQMQRGQCKGLEVREGTWGLGAFITEPAEEGDLIAEYVGQLIYESTTECREDTAKYRGRNYVFGLNSTLSVDSTKVGNATRFINHCTDTPGSPLNCRACVRLINDEHRIGIYALKAIKKGEEVLIDYGPSFFTDEHDNKTMKILQRDC